STTTAPAGAAATDTVATAAAEAAGVNTGRAAADFTTPVYWMYSGVPTTRRGAVPGVAGQAPL
ncbi:hypothetical protein, partial [Streptomyces goshikiensis]|uniref:hypothetical protein n=1 Tax=Streptomyces goshikiensis TaxID=1942 RepID=UPI003686F4DB